MLDILRDAATRIRANARASTSSPDVVDGLRTLTSTVGYVRASTSRVGRRRFGWEAESREVSRFVARGGEVVAETTEDARDGAEGRGRVATGILSREEAWAYHNRLIDRQHFGRRLKKYRPEPL
jgi:hypothetical protein